MANNNSQSRGPETIHVSVEIPRQLIGTSLIDGLRRSFTTDGQEEQGDEYMDQLRDLLTRHHELLDLYTQNIIRQRYDKVIHAKERLENQSGLQIQKFLQARKYKLLSRKNYKVVKRASDKVVNGLLMAQLAEAVRGPRVEPENSNLGTATVASNPFSDSHVISTLTDIHVNDLDEVELTTFKTDDNSDAAAVLDLIRRDGLTQHLVATCSVEAFSSNRTDGEASQTVAPEATTALSIHREDGTSPRLVTTPLPYLSPGDQSNRDAETHTISSVALSEMFEAGASKRQFMS